MNRFKAPINAVGDKSGTNSSSLAFVAKQQKTAMYVGFSCSFASDFIIDRNWSAIIHSKIAERSCGRALVHLTHFRVIDLAVIFPLS